MTRDAFKCPISVGDMVLFSMKTGAGTEYSVGEIVKILKSKQCKIYFAPDKVEICVQKTNRRRAYSKNPILYASNVVRL